MAGKTFVLVHGAWHGAWCWQRVASRLRQGGHSVHAPTLTGVGDRSHLLAPGIGLATHVSDVTNLLRWEDLHDVVLCGHSYAGFVASGVAEAVPERIAGLVLLDAFMPEDGEALVDQPTPNAERIRAAARNGAIAVPPVPAAAFKVNAADCALVDGKCTPHPIGCFMEPIVLTGARDRVARRAYVRAAAYPSEAFDAAKAKAAARGWQTIDIPAGHDVMLDAPDALADVLERM